MNLKKNIFCITTEMGYILRSNKCFISSKIGTWIINVLQYVLSIYLSVNRDQFLHLDCFFNRNVVLFA